MNELTFETLKDATIKILEILSTADDAKEATNDQGDHVICQYIIDKSEVKECKALLAKLDPGNQQLRVSAK